MSDEEVAEICAAKPTKIRVITTTDADAWKGCYELRTDIMINSDIFLARIY